MQSVTSSAPETGANHPEKPIATPMTRREIQSSLLLALVYALRMLGLFLILPVFAIHASQLAGGHSSVLVGLALGIYGLLQACLLIPVGMASDRYGRKPLLVLGLLLFAFGSFVAAFADSLTIIIIGRALQGAGAISAVISAYVADITRSEHRAKAMAIIGSSIGLSFALSLVTAPLLYKWVGMSGIFVLTGILALLAMFAIITCLPTLPTNPQNNQTPSLLSILANRELLKLNYGAFALHTMQMALFVVVPSALVEYAKIPLIDHWKIYLPVILISFAVMAPVLWWSEKYGQLKKVMLIAISLLVIVQLGFIVWLKEAHMVVVLLLVFFVAFNLLEACLPASVSRLADPNSRGSAFGVHNTIQALGIFCGAVLGGWLKGWGGVNAVFLVTTSFGLVWLLLASKMKLRSTQSVIH